MDETSLPTGRMTTGIVRRGDRIWRPMGPWSAAVHEYLRHLESAGFSGAPRVLGVEDDREILTYLDGEVAADPDWVPGRGAHLPEYARTDEALAGAARLIRELHEAARGFTPRSVGYRFAPHPPGPGQLVSHGDLGPWNTVYRDGVPAAFIDWDAAGPVEPLVDLASAAWAFVPLAPRRRLRESGFDPVPDLPARLRIFVDAYGLTDRRTILPALQRSKIVEAGGVEHWPIGPADAAVSLTFFADELRWLDDVRAGLYRAL
jgi:hypothetical protein